ncbi:MAG TPA: cache domain-containing protein [Anaerolineae bacterium]
MPFAIKWRSLAVRIIAWSFVPTAIVLLAVAYVAFYAYQRAAEDLVTQRNQEVARLSATELSTGLSEYGALLAEVAQPLGIRGTDSATIRDGLAGVRSRLAVFDGGVVFLDSFGIVRGSEPARSEIANQNWSDRSYFRQVFRTHSVSYSDTVPDGPAGSSVVVVAVPVTGSRGEFAGALAGLFRLDATAVSAFYGGILKLRLGENGNISLVDGQGRLIYDPNPSLIGRDVSGKPAVRQLLTTGSGSLRTTDTTGQDIVAAYAPIPGTPWGLVSEETRSALLAPTAGYRRFLIFLLVLGLVAPAVFVAFGVGQITRPIADLTAAAKGVADGNFEHQIQTGTGDELEQLAAQFNAMAARLQDSYATLEHRVEVRTRALRTLNTIAEVVNGSLDLADILENALDEILEASRVDTAVAYRLVDAGPKGEPGTDPFLKLITYRGISDETARQASHHLSADGAASEAIATLRPVLKYAASYPDTYLKEMIRRESICAIISVPLVAKSRVLGILNLGMHAPRVVLNEELSLLASIGQQVGLAMENARLYEKAEEVAAAAERSRLARDLHDAVTQTLFSASLIAEVLPKLWERNPEEGQRRLHELRQLTRGALAEMRTLLLELRPSALTEAQLGDLLKQLGESVAGRARLAVTVTVDGRCPLAPDVQVALYRIAQEALNNIAKHSNAGHAWVRLHCREECTELAIEDDGLGFAPEAVGADHLGLGIMHERAAAIGADLTIDSEPGSGTTIEVTWPGGRHAAQD